MNLLHGNKFSPWEDFFVNPFGSDVINPNQLCKCTCMYRCWSKHMCGGTMKKFTPGKYNCFINLVPIHCKNVRVIITLVWSSQLHLFRGFYYTRMITVYKPHIEILIATFCFQNWWSRTAKALQSWETPNRCNSDNHSNFKMTLTFLQCSGRYYIKAAKKGQETSK